jgi:hypothetical protein
LPTDKLAGLWRRDVSLDLSHVDILRVVGHDTMLHSPTRLSHGRGVQWYGSCPWCQGTDRFLVETTGGADGRGVWRCRQCSPTDHWDDAVTYVMRHEHVSFLEACRRLEVQLDGTGGTGPRPHAALAPTSRPCLPVAPQPALEPVVVQCHDALLAEEKALAYLAARGIDKLAIRQHKLGYAPEEGVPTGLTDASGRAVVVEHGITIPEYGVDGLLYGVKVRRPVSPSTAAPSARPSRSSACRTVSPSAS